MQEDSIFVSFAVSCSATKDALVHLQSSELQDELCS